MGELVEFPKRPTPTPPKGYCMSCGVECRWPSAGAWPEACPNGCTPFAVSSWFPEPGRLIIRDGAGNFVTSIET